MASLSKDERDNLPDADYACPGKRKLPMHDAKHVRMAWDMVNRTKDLSDAERAEARHRILRKAKELGIDTSDWATIKAMAFEAMSLAVPETPGHVNKMPFTGVLTRIEEPSDAPPNGSGGRRVLLTRAAAEAALPGLLGQGVDCTADFKGHDAQQKVAVITDAEILGNAIHIGGFIWAADFPDTAARIRAMKADLGFSYELKNVQVADPGADPLVIDRCDFTGAAILFKADAAYHTTSLAASKETATGDIDMTKEELEAIVAAALKPVTDELTAIKASQAKVESDLKAGKETHAKIKPHADALRACSAAMEAAGVGGHATKGPSAHLNRMADRMEAEAMVGKLPHIYRDHDYFVDASGDSKPETKPADDATLKPVLDQLAALGTQVKDIAAAQTRQAQEPERKSVSASTVELMTKLGLEAGADGKIPLAQVDKTLEVAGISGARAMEAKLKLREEGVLAA